MNDVRLTTFCVIFKHQVLQVAYDRATDGAIKNALVRMDRMANTLQRQGAAGVTFTPTVRRTLAELNIAPTYGALQGYLDGRGDYLARPMTGEAARIWEKRGIVEYTEGWTDRRVRRPCSPSGTPSGGFSSF